MVMIKEFLSYRSHVIALVALFVASLALAQIPLFNYLGYEFSALIVLLWSLSAGLLTISLWNKREVQTNEGFAAFAARSLATVLLALVIPLVVIAVNAFFVKNCSFPQGFILFFLVTVLGVVFAHALSLVCLVAFPCRKKTSFVIAWIAVLAQIPYVGLTGPQIFAFNPILIKYLSRLHHCYPAFRWTFALTHSCLCRFLCYRFIWKYPYPHLSCSLHIPREGYPCCLYLSRSNPSTFKCLQSIISKTHNITPI